MQTKTKRTAKRTLALNSGKELPGKVPEMEGQPPSDGHGDNGESQDDGRSINQGTSEETTEINEQKDNTIPEVPTVQANFITSLVKFGVKPASAKAITDYIVATGSPLVFEDALELLAKMTKFPFQVPALIRRQVLDYWVAINKIELPDDYEKQVNKMDKTDKEDGSNDSEARVTLVGGKIMATDKPMSISEAQKVQAAIEAVSGDGKKDGKGSDEAKFTIDENGELTVLPGAHLSVLDAMLFGAIKQKRAAGDSRDPLDILAESMGKVESVKAALGVQGAGGGNNPLSTPEGLKGLKEVFGADEATRTMIKEMSDNFAKAIEKLGEKPKDDPQMTSLNTRLEALTAKYEDEKEARHKMENDQLRSQIESLRGDIKALSSGNQAKDAYDIMGKAIDTIGAAGKDLKEGVLQSMTRGTVPAVTTNQKKNLTAAMGVEADKAIAARQAGAALFGKQAPATPPATPPSPPPFNGPPTIGPEGM